MRTGRPKPLKAFGYIGRYRYFLTFCTFQRRHLFVDKQRVDVVHAQILRAANEEQFSLSAYCYMPDHLHVLIEGQADASDCRRFIRLAKQLSGYHFERRFAERLWQRYRYERTLRSDEDLLSVARYICENPVRARLVQRASDYPFVGSQTHTLEAILDAIQFRRWSG